MNKLSKWTKLAYGLGHVHNDIAATICFSFSLLYMQASNFKCFRHTVGRCRGPLVDAAADRDFLGHRVKAGRDSVT